MEAESVGETDGRKKFKEWLNKPLKVVLSDGRTVTGTFLSTDKAPNIVVGSTREFWLKDGRLADGQESRCIGLAMVPAAHIVSISVLQKALSTKWIPHLTIIILTTTVTHFS